MLDFFSIETVDSTDYPNDPQCEFGFKGVSGAGLSLLNKGSKIVRYSFDGETDHGELDPTDPSVGEVFDNRKRGQLWLRLADDETGSTTVKVVAWVNL